MSLEEATLWVLFAFPAVVVSGMLTIITADFVMAKWEQFKQWRRK